MRSADILPEYEAPMRSQVIAIESALQCTTVVAMPFAPCDGESKVHWVLPDIVSEKLNTNGTFICPRFRSPRQEPFKP